MEESNIIHFDWAIKRLLRDKVNFVVLEGFLQSLLNEKIRIEKILESEGNQIDETDKFNRVDILAENSRGELVIIEVQNTRELYYFQRMLYGVSKAITDYISLGNQYAEVKKVYSINIVYFDLGQGEDYIYHGTTCFVGIHNKDILYLSPRQKAIFVREQAGDIFPEYYVLRVNDFNDIARTSIDEWIEYLKTGKINDNAKAPGLNEARERLKINQLGKEERMQYYRHIENLRVQWDVLTTAHIEGKEEGRAEGWAEGKEEGWAEGRAKGRAEGRAEGKEEGKIEGKEEGRQEGKVEGRQEEKINVVKKSLALGLSEEMIAQLTDLTIEDIKSIIKTHCQ